MDLMTSPSESWMDFAEAFFAVEEDRRRHSFLARNSIHFLEATELPVIETRIAQSAIPEIADASLIVLRSDGGDWDPATVVHRYEEDEAAFQSLRRLPLALTDALAASPALRVLSPLEIEALAEYAPGLSAAIAAPLGKPESPIGYCVFFQTASMRAFQPEQTRLIRDLILHAEHVILHARATEFLRREVRAREKFISIASHELKTPLTALKLQIDSLRRDFRRDGDALPPERIEKSFSTLDRSIHRLTQSINMLFSVSEIRAGQIGLLKEPSDLARLVREILSRMETLMKAAGCELVATVPEELPAFVDARRIEQALINLLANAAKYAPRCRVEVSLIADAERARIEIRDHGPGIPEQDQEKIFEAFNRGGSQTAVEGLGLGLFITQGVIRAHGGNIVLTSVPGAGACFAIEVPRWLA